MGIETDGEYYGQASRQGCIRSQNRMGIEINKERKKQTNKRNGLKKAHTKNIDDAGHTLYDHSVCTASLCSSFAAKFKSANHGYIIGLLHDLGKASPEFQRYLSGQIKTTPQPYHPIYGSILAYLILQPLCLPIIGHHTEIPNPATVLTDLQHQYNFDIPNNIKSLIPTASVKLPDFISNKLTLELWIRMLYSCLVDADYLDTENYMRGTVRDKYPSLDIFWDKFHKNHISGKTNNTVNNIRHNIYQHILSSANCKPGFYSITAPTGSGKTKTSIAFALKHALFNGFNKVIIALPYLSIIDQTVNVCKDIFGKENVVEHHSEIEYGNRNYLATENWDAPFIVTTTIQLLESLFSNRPSKCRKLHNVCNSVIIFDEVQTLPQNLLSPILEALKQLVDYYNVTVIFCTATQPALTYNKYFQSVNIQELVPNSKLLFKDLKRVEYEFLDNLKPCKWEQVTNIIKSTTQSLTVVNTKKDADIVLNLLNDKSALYLSTRLYSAHRKRVIKEIKRRLDSGLECKVVSTQVVEAGVDLDFPVVLRAIGPLDSIVQVAGRCNREGKNKSGRMIIFNPKFGGLPRGVYKTSTDIAKSILGSSPDLHRPEIYHNYFKLLGKSINEDTEIMSARERLDFPETNKFKIIKDTTYPVLLMEYLGEDKQKTMSVLQKIKKYGMSQKYMRQLQPYLIRLYENDIKKASISYVPDLEMYMWTGKYNEISGLSLTTDPADLIL